jgi:hypothetical protein
MRLEGIKGLEEIKPAKFRFEESLGLVNSVDHAYQVTGGRWALGLIVGRTDKPSIPSGDSRPSRVAQAMIEASVGEDGEVWGRVRYDLEPNPGPVQPAVKDSTGHWLIPLGDHQARRVHVLWHRPSLSQRSTLPESVDLPKLPAKRVPTLICLFTSGQASITSSDPSFTRLDGTSWDVEIAERLAPEILEAIGDLDLNSPVDRERLISDLVDLELRARTLARQTAASPVAIERIRAVLTNLKEMAEEVGIDEVFQEAEARVGLVKGFLDPSRSPLEDPAELIRIRRIGIPAYFRSRDDGSTTGSKFTLTRKPITSSASGLQRWTMGGLGTLISLVFSRWISRPHGRLRRRYRWLAIVVLGLALAWEPLGVASMISLLGLGRRAS